LTRISLRDRLLMDRKALLDLGTRNRLVNIPLRTKNIRAIEIIDEKSSEVFRLLGESNRLEKFMAIGRGIFDWIVLLLDSSGVHKRVLDN
jgi:hypothetical protein